ncbi:MAG: response regulator [Treponema sp.]|jgi:putative two-component system response regulator|nr:response regulator [Treponema sp.]
MAEKFREERDLIFIVDDNPSNLRIVKNILADKYSVATAPSADKLFNLLENNRPSLILLDIEMPEIDGYETIKVLKSKPETRDVPVIFLTGRTEIDDEIMGFSLGAVDYITKPIQPILLLKRVEIQLLVEKQKIILKQQAAELKFFNDNLRKLVDEKTQSVLQLQNVLLKTMAELVEYRDDITGRHIERTQKGIRLLLIEIKNDSIYMEEAEEWDIDLLVQSCQLHDVGKIFISDSILRKPGELNYDEFEDIKVHTHVGKQIVEKVEILAEESEFLRYAKIFAESHHEKWDGSGYPNGLKGTDIPLLGRVMAIADVYDALVSVRPYKNSYTHEEAVDIIKEGSGTQFDPELVKIFLRVSDQFKD